VSTVFLYLHTHWDREWYLPFEGFRTRLLTVVRKVVEKLESGELPSFYFDGQAAVLEDSTAVDGELAPRLRKLMTDRVLAAGPWYVLADQMLVCGESLVRNLALGLAATGKFGPPAMIGYCPDTFGHSQDLPRILSGFGITSAVVWRGVPALEGGPAFWWQSPDGSRVLAYHLSRGYTSFIFHENIPAAARVEDLLGYLDRRPDAAGLAPAYCALVDGALHPVGGDHLGPPPAFEQRLAEAASALEERSGAKVALLPLSEFLGKVAQSATGNGEGIKLVAGELRSNAQARQHGHAYMLAGVLSSRLYLKRENRIAEHRLIRLWEPLLSVLHVLGRRAYPAAQMEHAWRLLLQNHPHDSICGCSVDAVHDEMQVRTRRLHAVLDAVEAETQELVAGQDAMSGLSHRDPAFGFDRLYLCNLSAHEVSGPVKVRWASDLEAAPPRRSNDLQMISSKPHDELFGGGELATYYKNVALNEAWVWAEAVPPLGWRERPWPVRAAGKSSHQRVRVSGRKIGNGLLSLELDSEGRLTVDVTAGAQQGRRFNLGLALRDVGDGGDTYNFDPLPGDVPVAASLRSVKVGDRGPLAGSLIVTHSLEIPEGAQVQGSDAIPRMVRSGKTRRHLIRTEISLRRGVPMIFFETTWENRSADHRLEVVFDAGGAVTRTYSENHFSVVERAHEINSAQLPVEPGTEAPLDRFPCQRFFIANGQVFLNQGLPEYGVEGNQVSLTILRAVSILSRGRMLTRGGGAGPHLPTPGANCPGENRARYGWAPLPAGSAAGSGDGPSDEQIVQAYSLADQFEGCLWAAPARASAEGGAASCIRLTNQAIRLSAFHIADGGTSALLRLLNVTCAPQQLTMEIGFDLLRACRCSLSGQEQDELVPEVSAGGAPAPGARLQNVLSLAFCPNELITVKFLLPRPD